MTDIPAAGMQAAAQHPRVLQGSRRRAPQPAARRPDAPRCSPPRSTAIAWTTSEVARLSLPDDHRRQRDDDQAARQRALLALAQPRAAARGRRRPAASSRAGSRRRCATTARRRRSRARSPSDVDAARRDACAPASASSCSSAPANRDERVFPEPDRFDVRATPAPCCRSARARISASARRWRGSKSRVALEEVQARLPDYEIDPRGLARIHSVNVRGFAALPIAFPKGEPRA